MSKCEHLEFVSFISIGRLTDGETGPVNAYTAEIKIQCKDCSMPFMFIGPPMGLLWDQPTVSPDAQELRCPIRPSNEFAEPSGKRLPSFRITPMQALPNQ